MLIELLRSITFLAALFVVGLGYWRVRLLPFTNAITDWAVGLFAVGSIAFMVFLWFNHVTFPLNLDLMESTILQHVTRLASGQYVYVAPTPEYVPLAYNPLFYVISLPLVKLFGVNLVSLRITAIVGMFGIGVMIFLIVRDQTHNTWWAVIGVGLFAAAYRVMDTFLDNAHSDGWFIFSALLGTYVISKNRSYVNNLLGVVILVASFWFKQHGVIFVIGGLAYLLWRDGWRPMIGYGLIVVLLGVAAYLFGGSAVFGPYFLYFTYQVPRHWTEVNLLTFYRYLRYILQSYPILAFFAALETVWTARSKYRRLTIWHFQFAAALATGVMGSLDPGSANNVYIPMGLWFIILGTIGLYNVTINVATVNRHHLASLAFITTFGVFLYIPATVIVSPQADEIYQEFISTLKNLNGQVYAPYIGQLNADYVFVPGAHWVALEDMVRGPGIDEQNHPTTRKLLEAVIQPDKPAYMILPYRLEGDPLIGFLTQYYVLDTDFGDRFKALATLPKRFSNGWPRYLYRYNLH
ncbi:MAG: hypothetical protein GC179_07140 [Anaerolineaceae bacterium]|nr:hypothetical protein [Anaerolineaceae bacterium]